MTEFHDKVNSFDFELINHDAFNKQMCYIITEGILPYNNFTEFEWKNGTFFYYKHELCEIWCNSYNGGQMSFLIKYNSSKSTIGTMIHYNYKYAFATYNRPSNDNTDKSYFDLVCKEYVKSLEKNTKVKNKNTYRKLLSHVYIEDKVLNTIIRNIELFEKDDTIEAMLFCDGVTNENFSEVHSIVHDLFYIKHYMDD